MSRRSKDQQAGQLDKDGVRPYITKTVQVRRGGASCRGSGTGNYFGKVAIDFWLVHQGTLFGVVLCQYQDHVTLGAIWIFSITLSSPRRLNHYPAHRNDVPRE